MTVMVIAVQAEASTGRMDLDGHGRAYEGMDSSMSDGGVRELQTWRNEEGKREAGVRQIELETWKI